MIIIHVIFHLTSSVIVFHCHFSCSVQQLSDMPIFMPYSKLEVRNHWSLEVRQTGGTEAWHLHIIDSKCIESISKVYHNI